jgi:hypothetical protein
MEVKPLRKESGHPEVCPLRLQMYFASMRMFFPRNSRQAYRLNEMWTIESRSTKPFHHLLRKATGCHPKKSRNCNVSYANSWT